MKLITANKCAINMIYKSGGIVNVIDSSLAESDKPGVSILWDSQSNKQCTQSGCRSTNNVQSVVYSGWRKGMNTLIILLCFCVCISLNVENESN